jgi:hypothetical protein
MDYMKEHTSMRARSGVSTYKSARRVCVQGKSRPTNEYTALPQSPFSFPIYNRKSNARVSRLSHL